MVILLCYSIKEFFWHMWGIVGNIEWVCHKEQVSHCLGLWVSKLWVNLEYYIGEEEKLTHTIMGHKRINPAMFPSHLYELNCGLSTFLLGHILWNMKLSFGRITLYISLNMKCWFCGSIKCTHKGNDDNW